MPFDRKKELDAMEDQGPMPFGEEEDMAMDEMEMPEEGADASEPEAAYSPDEIKDLYSTNMEFASKVDEFAADFMEAEPEEDTDAEEEGEYPEEEEAEELF